MAEGWRRSAPQDDLTLVPLSDGGPGFTDVMSRALGGSSTVTETVAPPSALDMTSVKPGPPSDSGTRVRSSCGALRRQPSAIASAASPALRVPVKQSGAMSTCTRPCCQVRVSGRVSGLRCKVVVKWDDQAGTSAADASVDRQY